MCYKLKKSKFVTRLLNFGSYSPKATENELGSFFVFSAGLKKNVDRINPFDKILIESTNENKYINTDEMATLAKKSTAIVSRPLSALTKSERVGSRKSGYWVVKKPL